MPLKKNKKIKENNTHGLITEASFLFKEKKLNLPELEAQILLSHVLKKDRSFILAHPEYIVPDKETKEFFSLVKKRLSGWSSAVILGHKEFYGLDFLVNKNVLVPRPETEILVDTILTRVKSNNKTLIIDIGTGSGAIITSLFKNLETRKDLGFYASDKSKAALKVAKYNAKHHKAKVNFLSGDLLKPYLPILKKLKPNNIIIAANLPYLNPKEMKETSIKKEPKSALLSGHNGLWHYKRLFSQLKKISLPKVFLICEINPEQASEIKKLATTSFPLAKTYFQNDYTKRIRFFILEV